MEFDLVRYKVEIEEFLNVETLRQIDYGTLDLSGIKDPELKGVLLFFEELLTAELEVNYLKNRTGIFRVHIIKDKCYYKEFDYVIEADCLWELRELVLLEDRIWYVFDEILAEDILGGRK